MKTLTTMVGAAAAMAAFVWMAPAARADGDCADYPGGAQQKCAICMLNVTHQHLNSRARAEACGMRPEYSRLFHDDD
jgi:hypothetical protein